MQGAQRTGGMEAFIIDIQFLRSWPNILETTEIGFLLVRITHTLPISFGWVQDDLPERRAAQLESVAELDVAPTEFTQLFKLYLIDQYLASGSSSGKGGELLYLFSHAIIQRGCYTNIQSVLSLVTHLFKTSMGKQKMPHPRIPQLAYVYNTETRIA